jgi:hypothetical protein
MSVDKLTIPSPTAMISDKANKNAKIPNMGYL